MFIMRLHTIVPRPQCPLAVGALGEPTSASAASRDSRTPAGGAVARRRWRTCLSPLLITAGLGLLLGAVCYAGDVQPIMGPPLPLTITSVNNGPGDQSSPHVSGALVTYTDQSNDVSIHVHDLVTGEDTTIPNNGAFDSLSNISGTTVVYMHFTVTGTPIMAYDVATDGPPVELAPRAGGDRRLPAIGGTTVAWSDFWFYTDPTLAELVLYDLPTGTTTRLTNDLMFDTVPAVSPLGDVVVWQKCQAIITICDIWQATRSGSGWTTTALTAGTADENHPHTNGTLVVYDSQRNGERDIYWQPVGGGPEQRLLLPGFDQHPHIAGTLMSFEHLDTTAPIANWAVYLYDVATNILYRLTQTLDDEVLSDITIDEATGLVRVVLTRSENLDLNVYALSFPQSALVQMGVPFASFALTRLQIRLHDQNDKIQIAGTFTPGAGLQVDPATQPVSLTLTRPGEATPFWPPSGVMPIQGFTLSGSTYSMSPVEKQRTGINAFDLVTGWSFNAVDTDAPLAAGTYTQVDVVLQIGTQLGGLTAQLVETPIGSGNWQLK